MCIPCIRGRPDSSVHSSAVQANPNIQFHEHHLASDFVYDTVNGVRHCLGADVLDKKSNQMTRFVAPVTLLATGGAGQVSSVYEALHLASHAYAAGQQPLPCFLIHGQSPNSMHCRLQVYPITTNPHVCTGDGMAMAFRAQADISNMEFVQFHPTGFWTGSQAAGSTFLISEAVRGEGGSSESCSF